MTTHPTTDDDGSEYEVEVVETNEYRATIYADSEEEAEAEALEIVQEGRADDPPVNRTYTVKHVEQAGLKHRLRRASSCARRATADRGPSPTLGHPACPTARLPPVRLSHVDSADPFAAAAFAGATRTSGIERLS